MSQRHNALPWQALSFVLIGGLQVLLDWLVFFVLTALAVPVPAGNLAGRMAGASLGFWLNGRVTFRRADGSSLNRRALARFIVLWLLMTTISTGLLTAAAQQASLSLLWLLKPVIELLLALLSFFINRHWVYR